MRKVLAGLMWAGIALLGALSAAVIALARHEPLNALWLLTAALCTYLIGYRFYSKFLVTKVLLIDARRATPAERLEDGRDFVPTHKWVTFGHHFAAIAGPGPLVGPVLAAQFGYLPGTLWILVGAVLGGCVQDCVILLFSLRRDGKSLGQMAREEIGKLGGGVGFLAVWIILVILLAVVGLVVVNALKGSPWGTFTIFMTLPIALLMGVWMKYVRPGKVLETSVIGLILVLAAVWGGRGVAASAEWAPWFTCSAMTLAAALIGYGFAASTLPVWLLLAPRDYLSTFVKLGTIAAMALGIVWYHPMLQMPALSRFTDGTGPVFAGKIFPFCFITIACGAVSGFHSLISSGTTPKLLRSEKEVRTVGYGAMLCESFVAIMAMIAACVLQPGVYFAVNSPAAIVGATPAAAAATISAWGYPVQAATMAHLAQQVGESSLFYRTGGAPSLALGLAQVFAHTAGGEALLGVWYHFAIMFEALFILTVLDAGTRVGRFMVQETLAHLWKPLGRTGWYPSIVLSSAVMVAAWGVFLVQGVRDPLGGINSLWPLFGIANQLLAAVALSLATTQILKTRPARYAWVTLAPLIWLATVCFTAGWQKIFSADPHIGFLSAARIFSGQHAGQLAFNARLDAGVTGLLLVMVAVLLMDCMQLWVGLLTGRRLRTTWEAPFQLSAYAEEGAGAD